MFIKGILLILEILNLKIHTSVKSYQTYYEGIKSFNHKMHTYESNKISLSVYDDKGYIKHDGIHTLSYGHKDIPTRNW